MNSLRVLLILNATLALPQLAQGQRASPTQGEPRWTIAAKPSLTIGEVEGAPAYLFSQVVGTTRLSNGGIVVADRASNQIRFYDRAGRHTRTVGRTGEGPGEYEYIRALMRCGGDSIFAFDLHWDEKVYTNDGRLIREQQLTLPESGFRSPYNLGCSSSGTFVAQAWGTQVLKPETQFYRSSARVFILNRDGRVVADLGDFPNSERLASANGSRPHPFGRQTAIAIGRDHVYIGTGERMEVSSYDFGGMRGPSYVGPVADLAIRPTHLAAYLEERVATVDDTIKPRLRREIPKMPLPPSFPAYSALEVDPAGNLWVERFLKPGERQHTWLVFDRTGNVLADVAAPSGLNVFEIGADYVLGVHRDEDGVERVQLYALTKR